MNHLLRVLAAGCMFSLVLPALAFDDDEDEDDDDKKPVAGRVIALGEAVQIAQGHMGGGQLVELKFDADDEEATYELVMLGADRIGKFEIDGMSGRVEKADVKADAEDVTKMQQAVGRCRYSLPEILGSLEHRYPGSVVREAKFKDDDKGPMYKIKLKREGLDIKMDVDCNRGIEGTDRYEGEEVIIRETTVEGGPPAAPPYPSSPPPPPPAEGRPMGGGPVQRWDFDSFPSGDPFAGWQFVQTRPTGVDAVWEIMADTTSPSAPNVLAVAESRCETQTFNIAVVEQTSVRDVDLSVAVRADAGVIDQGGGPVWRFQNPDNYYVCRFNPLEGNFRVYNVVDGKRNQLASANAVTTPGKWYTVRVTMVGDRITCYLDGIPTLEARDNAIPNAGAVGVWAKADAVTSFDKLAVMNP